MVSFPVTRGEAEKAILEAEKNKSQLIAYCHKNEFGHDMEIKTPYGMKPLIYCDYTASGRNIKFIEEYIKDEVCSFLNSSLPTQHIF